MPGSLFLNKQESHEILHFSIPSKPSRAISSTQSNRACICRFVGHICTALSEFSLVFQAIIFPRMGPSVKKISGWAQKICTNWTRREHVVYHICSTVFVSRWRMRTACSRAFDKFLKGTKWFVEDRRTAL